MRRLGEFIEIIKGNKIPEVFYEYKPSTYRYIQIEDLRPGSVPKYAYNKQGILATKNDVLIAWDGANAGTVGFGIEGYPGSTIAIIRPKYNNIYGPFLGYFLHSLFQYIQTNCVGATIPHVNRQSLEELPINFPSSSEQKRIVAILEKADRLRRLRRYALELSDTYLQTVFLEMFGDPVTNPNSLEFKTLGDIIHSTQDGPHVSPDYTEKGIPFLSTRNIRPGQVIWDDLKFIPRKDAEKYWERCKPERGDILYTKGGTTGLAKVVDFDTEVAIWVHIALLKPNHNIVDSSWLESMLNSDFCYNQSQELTHGIANHDLGLNRMIKIKLYLPPLPLQKKFAQIAKKYKRFQAQQREAARQAEHLFQTLLHQAFEGELTSVVGDRMMGTMSYQTDEQRRGEDASMSSVYQAALPME